jgi:sec-independent protein translocase protein TatC
VVVLRRKKADRPTDGTMTLMEHLYELRHRLFLAVLGIFLGSVIGFIWFANGVPSIGLKSLGDILIEPYCAVPVPPRVAAIGTTDIGTTATQCQLLATTPFSILQLRLKAAIMAGAVISCPIWLYQLWAFVTPALYSKERKFAIIFVSCAGVLFLGGAVLAYAVISEGLKVLLGFGGDTTVAALSPDSYYSFLIALLLIFGVSFELPLLLIMLNQIGVVSGKKLARWRRYSIFGMFVFAALVVPGNDPITMSALALALCLLYEVAVQVSKLHDRRKAKAAVESGEDYGLDYSSLSDDEASPMPGAGRAASSGTIGGVRPVDRPTPVADATPVTPPQSVQTDPLPPDGRPSRDDFGDAT